jgi:hypothetical protein
MLIFSLALVGFLINYVMSQSHYMKVLKHTGEPCCHLATETGSFCQGILKGEVSLYH